MQGAPRFPVDVQQGCGVGGPYQPSGCWHKPLIHVETVSLKMGCLPVLQEGASANRWSWLVSVR